jgi:hypothetical protein
MASHLLVIHPHMASTFFFSRLLFAISQPYRLTPPRRVYVGALTHLAPKYEGCSATNTAEAQGQGR